MQYVQMIGGLILAAIGIFLVSYGPTTITITYPVHFGLGLAFGAMGGAILARVITRA
jgi:predicted tellurium resistance membrane protein TerC